jgi:hypothetical protein
MNIERTADSLIQALIIACIVFVLFAAGRACVA